MEEVLTKTDAIYKIVGLGLSVFALVLASIALICESGKRGLLTATIIGLVIIWTLVFYVIKYSIDDIIPVAMGIEETSNTNDAEKEQDKEVYILDGKKYIIGDDNKLKELEEANNTNEVKEPQDKEVYILDGKKYIIGEGNKLEELEEANNTNEVKEPQDKQVYILDDKKYILGEDNKLEEVRV